MQLNLICNIVTISAQNDRSWIKQSIVIPLCLWWHVYMVTWCIPVFMDHSRTRWLAKHKSRSKCRLPSKKNVDILTNTYNLYTLMKKGILVFLTLITNKQKLNVVCPYHLWVQNVRIIFNTTYDYLHHSSSIHFWAKLPFKDPHHLQKFCWQNTKSNHYG